MSEILKIAKAAKAASKELLNLSASVKNDILKAVADELIAQKEAIKDINLKDIKAARMSGMSEALIDRLTLTDSRIEAMSQGVVELANFKDIVGEVLGGWEHKNGLKISKVRVPLGVLGMIYESRPNVSIDAAALALKSSNAIILRGSASAINSNIFLVNLFNCVGAKLGLPSGAVSLIATTEREAVSEMIKLHKYIDVLIPRGGKKLKEFIIQNATIPVIETGSGVCYIYVDESADLSEAINIIKNAKMQRPSACNSVECVLLHEKIAEKILPNLVDELQSVELRVESKFYDKLNKFKNVIKADESDFGTEYLALILAIKSVADVGEAIEYINAHSSKHSDSIISQNYANIEQFLNSIDSAVVYANASTRFSDGGEFGFGGEIGISTQKLHARGPMGVSELTTYKYIVRGAGQTR
ncbi:glutamate-5-semialdehyde dehydrogenase [Campylobacter sp. faydin G-140]|uniref:glutamate-5-semialdehyde dehydrogenase n=1 Tax=Campylobacter anatolicus TaxID=2829105 RepID=UPI001BA0007D|nr:glutamate-5-semialdehyde dehydrogenase [Campylobacter anatolicus]MBR8466434.1 glutamate-5-semialdehyde dehydrogenase [Campylobacter anatolicus]